MVDEVSAPVVERPVPRDLPERIDRHLVEARDDEVVLIGRLVRVDIDLRAGNAVCDAVAERVRERVRDSLSLDVDGVHGLGAVERELDREEARAAADVEATLALPWRLLPEVLPDEQAARGRDEDVRLADDLRERQRVNGAAGLVAPGLRCDVAPRAAASSTSASGFARGWPGFVPTRRSRAAAMCAGEVPQQPPTICAPSLAPAAAPARRTPPGRPARRSASPPPSSSRGSDRRRAGGR